ncbi:hypothetical protein [Teichococcus aestuarii]
MDSAGPLGGGGGAVRPLPAGRPGGAPAGGTPSYRRAGEGSALDRAAEEL